MTRTKTPPRRRFNLGLSERISISLSRDHASLIARAARAEGLTVAAFVRRATLRAARMDR